METMMIGVQFSRRIVRHGYSRAGLKKDFLEHARDKEHQGRSEEHTSELQSRLHLVCRLLLEKKKKKKCNAGDYTLQYFTLRLNEYERNRAMSADHRETISSSLASVILSADFTHDRRIVRAMC